MLTAAGLVVATALAYHTTRAAEATMVANGVYDGVPDAIDKANARVVPYDQLTKPAALVAETDGPVAKTRLGPRHFQLDFGQDRFGALRLSATRPSTIPQAIEVVLGERLTADGRIWRHDPAQDTHPWIASLDRRVQLPSTGGPVLIEGPIRLRPRASELPANLTTVFPFRYAEIVGADPDDLEAQQVSVNAFPDASVSTFTSSSPELDAVWSLAAHTVKATSFAGLYLDGNRERRPYEADAYIAQLSQLNLDNDDRVGRRTLEYLLANPTWPTEWAMFPILSTYDDYLYEGDKSYLRQIYPKLKVHTLLGLARPDGLISTRDPRLNRSAAGALGLADELTDIVDWPSGERDGYARDRVGWRDFARLTIKSWADRALSDSAWIFRLPRARRYYNDQAETLADSRYRIAAVNTVVNAFHYAVLERMAYLAGELGYEQDSQFYRSHADQVKAAVLAKLLDPSTGTFRDGEGSAHHSLHANFFPLAFGLAPAVNQRPITALLNSKGMAASVYGAQFLLDGLYTAGQGDQALHLLTSNSDRSWLGMIRSGASLTTEAWNDATKPDLDWNHVWGSSPANIIPRWVVGVRPTGPGFSAFTVQPQPGSLSFFHALILSPKGGIVVDFKRGASDRLQLNLIVPKGAAAQVVLPQYPQTPFGHISVDGRLTQTARAGAFVQVGQLGPGSHIILATGP